MEVAAPQAHAQDGDTSPSAPPVHAPPAAAGGVRIASLDGLRAISILGVLLAHLHGTRNFLPIDAGRAVGDVGNLGVRVFFIISGYLITSLLFRELEKTGRISLKGFYLRRTFRIFPAFYAYLAIIVGVRALGLIPLSTWDAVHAATYTVNYVPQRSWYIGHLWSLSVEEQFYLLWPAALVLCPPRGKVGELTPADIARGKRRSALWMSLAVIAAAPVARTATWWLLPEDHALIGEAFPTIADSIAFGCLLANVQDRLGESPRYLAFLRSRWFAIVPLAMLVVNRFGDRPRVYYPIGETLLDLLIVVLIDRCVRFPDGASGRFLNSRVMSQIGVFSYSIYLWQQPFLNRASSATVHSFPANVALALGCALLSYHLIERPMLRLRVRLFDRRPKPTSDAAPPLAA